MGCRVQRVKRGKRSELGGFKGAEKLASDRDLTIPKSANGAAVVVQETDQPMSPSEPRGGHERVGSWELREQQLQKETQQPRSAAGLQRRPSYEDDDDVLNVNPYAKGMEVHQRV